MRENVRPRQNMDRSLTHRIRVEREEDREQGNKRGLACAEHKNVSVKLFAV